MKKSIFIGLVAVLGLIGCSRNQEIDVPDANLSLFARTESPAESKTVVESGVHVFWEPGDEIAVYMGEKTAKFTTDLKASSATATFKGTFGDTTWPDELDLWAVYPFSEEATFDGETITTTLPSEQIAREGSFGKDMNLSIAHSNSSTLQFYNVGGGIRFSVTEEGIKKVMFEGLSGEIISGKVKIAFEDGLPVIKEVTGGSQFITLFPPANKETFEKDTWYYIVAIPGTLEGGYKLRFYKDTDYARKVSEKAVTIKRSIFGSLEKADEGIDFEPQTTHFPETEKECEKSVELTEAIQVEVNSILWDKSSSKIIDIDAKVEEISKIEGVISVEKNEDETCLSVVQRDSLCVNYMLYDPTSGFNETSRSEVVSAIHTLSASRSSADKANANNKEGKTALILAPFQKDFDKSIIDTWIPELSVNYSSENIKYLPNSEADLYQFKEQLSKQYDFILIDTHGITGKCARTSINPFDIKNAFLCTATPYNLDISWEILTSEAVRNNEVAVVAIPDGRKYVGVNPKILENASYNDSCVIITACKSAMTLDKKVPWLDTFLSKGALVVSGAKVSMQIGILGAVANQLIQVMTIGCSFKDAFTYVTKSSRMISLCNEIHTVFGGEFSEVNVRDNYIYKQNEHKPVQDYYLTNPKSHPNTPIVNGELTILSWSTSSISFPKTVYLEDTVVNNDLHKSPITFNQTFDVYVDGEKVSKSCFESGDNTGKTVTIPTPSSGPHSWKVITNIIEIDTGITLGSYASDEGQFTVSESSDEVTLISSIFGGKTYSVIRKNVSMSDCRINGDGSRFYPCSFYVKVNDTVYDLPGTFYSYQDHRPDSDMGPVMAVDTRTGDMRVFFIEKDDYQADKYSMRGHMFTISDGAISEQTIFTSDNFGWFPYFTWDSHQLVLNCFSFDQYFSITAAQFDNWALQKGDKIQPGDFSARQQANELILFYETATPWEGEIVLERKYKIWSSGDYKTNWEGKTSDNYAYPTIALVFDNDQSISVGYYNTYYWTSRSDRVFGIYIITGGQEQYVQPRIVDEWVKEKFVINGNGVVRYYTNDVFMGEWTFYLDLASAHSVRVVGNPYGWWYTHYHYMDDFSLKTPATSVSDNFNNGEIDLTIWEQPVNPDGVYEEDGYLHMIQKRTDEDFTIRSKSILIVN